ncbi:AsnC family transcriptional regulator [Vitreoscilla sp. C1]|nr:AsnC family transcriptional regulator [Vitreoscilla sp. C1]
MNSSISELDKIDTKIIHILQQNARISIAELSEKVGLSATPVKERMKRLQESGVITGFHAKINPHLIGQGLLVFVEIKLKDKSATLFAEFKRDVLRTPQIMECHLVSGEYDYLIKVRMTDIAAYRQMLGDILLQLPAILESRSYIVMEEVKETHLLPML